MSLRESEVLENEGWRSTDSSWLDPEKEDKSRVFLVNVIMEEAGHSKGLDQLVIPLKRFWEMTSR